MMQSLSRYPEDHQVHGTNILKRLQTSTQDFLHSVHRHQAETKTTTTTLSVITQALQDQHIVEGRERPARLHPKVHQKERNQNLTPIGTTQCSHRTASYNIFQVELQQKAAAVAFEMVTLLPKLPRKHMMLGRCTLVGLVGTPKHLSVYPRYRRIRMTH